MNTISNERLESLQRQFKEEGFNDISDSEIMQLVAENLAMRKEREQAEPFVCPKCGNTGLADSGGVQPWGEPILIECDCTAPPAPEVPAAYEINDDATDYHLGWNACRAAMLKSGNDDIGSWSNHKNTPTDKPKSEMSQKAEQLLRDTTALAATLSAETDTASQQFESLAGKAVGGWIACSEWMPEREYVLAADFSGAYYLPSLPNTQVGIYADWFEDGKPSWDDGDGNNLHLKQVTHWMPLPEPPCK